MRTNIKHTIFTLINLLAMVILSAAAFAEEEGHAAGHGGDEITFLADWLPRLINFGILAAVLVYFGRKPAVDFFKGRSAEIEKSMQESKEARERAVAALAEMETKIREMEAETRRMVADAQTRGERDRQALIAEGEKVARDVQEQVKTSMAIEVQKAKADLASEASLLAVDLAEGRIKSSISKQDHERIVKDYIVKVGGRG